MLSLLLLIALQTTNQAPTNKELKALMADIEVGMNQFVQEARGWSGSVKVFDTTDEKKLLRSSIVRTDGQRYLIQHEDGNKKPTGVDIFRPFGDIRQFVTLAMARNGDVSVRKEDYRKKGEPGFNHEVNRIFAYEAPAAIALRPVPGLPYIFIDFMDSPACQISRIETLSNGPHKLIKVSYAINKEVNDKLSPDQKIGVIDGWVEFRPNQLWTVHRSEFMIAASRRSPARRWKAEYVYETAPPNALKRNPVLKEIRLETIDQPAKAGEKTELQLVKQLYEFDFKPKAQPFIDGDFSMAQYGLKERTATDWLAEVAAKEKADAAEQAKIAALPPGSIKIASSKPNIDPWLVLIGGVIAFVLLVMWVYWSTSKPVRPAKPTSL